MQYLRVGLFALVAGIAQADDHSDYRAEFVKKVAKPCILQVVHIRLDSDVSAKYYLHDDQVVAVGLAVAEPSVNRMVKATLSEAKGKKGNDRAELFEQYLEECIAINIGKLDSEDAR